MPYFPIYKFLLHKLFLPLSFPEITATLSPFTMLHLSKVTYNFFPLPKEKSIEFDIYRF